ncbi:MAG: dihydroorotase [Actinomycetota bacterium]
MKKILGTRDMLIKNAAVIDPYTDGDYTSDILIEEGRIKEIAEGIKESNNVLEIDASGCIISPGLVDMHVHLRDPGDDKEEDIESGVRSALAGGFVAVATMPNTQPAVDSPSLIEYILGQAGKNDFKILPVAAITKELRGLEITEMGLLSERGAAAFSDDGKCVADARLMYEAMRYSGQFSSLLILHEEEYGFTQDGLVHEGYWSNRLGLEGISPLAEELIIGRDIMLAKKTGARIHITHLSSRRSVEMIRQAKRQGVNISCDVTPHHLYFNHSCLKTFNTNFKVKPPIRAEEDQAALVEGLKDGTIDAIASDHAPHLLEEKNTTFQDAQFGAIGMETAFKAAYTKLCRDEGMGLKQLIKLMTAAPSSILGMESMAVEEGNEANLVVIDTAKKENIKKEFFSKSKNCPFIGQELYSRVLYTINNGKLSYVRE